MLGIIVTAFVFLAGFLVAFINVVFDGLLFAVDICLAGTMVAVDVLFFEVFIGAFVVLPETLFFFVFEVVVIADVCFAGTTVVAGLILA